MVIRSLYLYVFFSLIGSFAISQEKHINVIKVSKPEQATSVAYANGRINDSEVIKVPVSISKNDLFNKNNLSDFIPELPSNCEDLSYEFSIELKSSIKVFRGNKNTLTLSIKNMLVSLKPGDKFFIDHFKTQCYNLSRKLYIVTIGK